MRFALRFLLILASIAGPASAAEGDANAIFLVASVEMRDPNFRETVVLVTHPREGAPWGVIINRPLEQRLSEIFTEFEILKAHKDTLFFGGWHVLPADTATVFEADPLRIWPELIKRATTTHTHFARPPSP